MERARALGIAVAELGLPGLGFSSNLLSAAVAIVRAGRPRTPAARS